MNRFFTILALCMLLMPGIGRSAFNSSFYRTRSVLADGKWVKIGVSETGIYEIDYADLRAMGFNDPSKVGVYGRGGRVLPENFTTNAGAPTFSDDLSQISVLHKNGKLYFYGLGPEDIKFQSDSNYPTGGYFTRVNNNIYTKRGYYFLSDVETPKAMTTSTYTATAPEVKRGVSYCYHELDSVQNNTGSGQLFWGERIGYPFSPKRSWQISMPDATGEEATMECAIYFSNHEGVAATVSYGFEDAEAFSTPYKTSGSSYFVPFASIRHAVGIPGNKGTVFTSLESGTMFDQANLDYWVVSYNRSMPSMLDPDGNALNQQYFALPDISRNTSGKFLVQNAENYEFIDVTSPETPVVLSKQNQGGGTYAATIKMSTSSTPQVVVFDTNKTQKQISGFEESYSILANQNLHGYKDTGADFVIISTSAFKSYAEEIARLHEEHDGIKVVVATAEECYNEFSGGVPDPMAYRSFLKMLYMTDRKPKNVMLFGPIHSDFRGIQVERDPYEGLIGYQSPMVSIARGAHNINDFYGCMTDQYNKDYYERNEVNIGVAIMPVHFAQEAEIVVNKIKEYLERDDFAYYLNTYMAVGGIGDDHTHDGQIQELANYIHSVDNNTMVVTPLSIDTYGTAEAKKKFANTLNEGRVMFSYFGHGAEQFLGKDGKFFSAGDVTLLRNKFLPLACFAGCQITNTDRGMRGLGESIVTTTPHGCIGSLVSARETWSGQNMEFYKQFFTCLFRSGSKATSTKLTEPKTIGEVYALVKHYSTYNNELAYQLLCDPALIIPTTVRNISVETETVANGGESFTVKGFVEDADGNCDSNYNGQVVVRVMEPTQELPCGNIESKEDPKNLKFTYSDSQVAMAVGEVKEGRFEVSLLIPSATNIHNGQNGSLNIAAYNKATKTGAGVNVPLEFKESPAGPSATAESKDMTPPVIEQFNFNLEDCSIDLTVSDNLALNMYSNTLEKGLSLFIDGKERSEAHFIEPVVEYGRPAFSKNVPLAGLTYGEHSARLKVKDVAGNVTEQEITFTYNPHIAKYQISLSEEFGEGESVFVAEGAYPADASIVILDSKGQQVWSGKFQNGRAVWDQTGTNGIRVKPGHYKAYIIERGSSTGKGHSDAIDVPVV